MNKTDNNKFGNSEVEEVFNKYPQKVKKKLLYLRQLIFNTAKANDECGDLVETLKWNQPSYITVKPKTGSTIRIDRIKSDENKYAIYFNCKTTLISTFKQIYPDVFTYEGNRSIIFNVNEKLPAQELKHCISIALLYHIKKNY